jgi:protein-L-isoaspartate(D-aspartate) O-methyltransferase
MLDLLAIEPGMRVLEIGTGSGWNAALLGRLVGPGGEVVSIDIDAELVERARPRLGAAGAGNVEVRAADGALGAPDRAPFDRVLATVGCDDVSPAWLGQLRPDGRVLVPLHHAGMDPLVELRPTAGGGGRGCFRGIAWFVPVQGDLAAATSERARWRLPPEVQDELQRTRGGGDRFAVELVPAHDAPAPAAGDLARLARRHHVEIVRHAIR